MPVSSTSICSAIRCRLELDESPIRTKPWQVNFTAFETKLSMTCRIRCWSPKTDGTPTLGVSSRISMPFDAATGSIIFAIRWTSSVGEKATR